MVGSLHGAVVCLDVEVCAPLSESDFSVVGVSGCQAVVCPLPPHVIEKVIQPSFLIRCQAAYHLANNCVWLLTLGSHHIDIALHIVVLCHARL